MESLKSSFLQSFPLNPPQKTRKPNKPSPPTILCCLKPDPWSLSSGNPKNLNKPKPKSKNPKNPLPDDNARRIIKAKANYLSVLRRNQGSRAQTPKWIKRTPEQMVQYLEDDRNGHLYGRHVVAAIKRVRSTSGLREGQYDMREVMCSFVTKLSFREMCVVLKEQKSWRQVRDFFAWMKLQLSYRPSVIAYTIVLRAYGQVGKIKLAEETFLEMLEAGCEPDEVACGTMLCSYARWGRHRAMLSFYSAVQERKILPSIPVFNFMLSSLQKKSLHKDVIYLWKNMVDLGVIMNHFTYTVVISSLVKAGMADEAYKTFREMKSLGFVPEESTYGLLISLSSKNGEKDTALNLYEDMRAHGLVPSNFTCASLLALYYRTADYSKACSLFTEMEKYGVIADEVIYGLLIRIYGKLGFYEDALRTFTEIERSGRLSDEKTYATMAQVHLNFGNFEKALDVMEQMKSNNTSFSRFSCIVLLQCYVVKGDLAGAEKAYRALSETGLPDATSCKDMLNLYLRLGLPEKAKAFVDEIRKDGIEFDEELFLMAMKVYCKGGMLREVEQFIEEVSVIEAFKNVPFVQAFFTVMNGSTGNENWFVTLDQSGAVAVELMLMLCLATRNEITMMKEKIELLLETKIGETVGNRMICKFAKEGDMSTTGYLYELMMKLGCEIEDGAKACVIIVYGKQKKIKRAKEVFMAVEGSATDRKVIYSSMIDAYVTCGREHDAYVFYKEETRKGHDLGAVSISKLVKALTSCGKYREAEEVISNSFHENLELDTVAYNTCIKAMLEAGKLRSAISIFERMLSLKIPPSIQTYNTMISVYGRGRNLDKAVEMFSMAQGMGLALDEKTYTNMICHYGKAGKVNEASALFSKMQEEGIKPGQMSYNVMINVYAAGGLYNEAEKLLLSMQTNDTSPDSLTYLAIIRAYIKGSKYSEAEKAIDTMHKEAISPSCAHFNLVLSGYTKSGLMDEADMIYQKIFSVGLNPNLESKSAMLRGYLDFRHVKEGISFFERECRFIGPDRFILSAAVHLYRSAGKEFEAGEILNSMNDLGVSFLNNLEVGSRTNCV
ncbi:pentatricopeptide repeat-containing protein at5g27270 [Phtheirospermum japonicum]|uniref:Pentatricopeptide repeat-containing protein at5g27270 n=1 Tax=Phtheirospermum japonicum TaxID=374723 RepID=A0A830C3S2_9LAMI|nr:pentatricopeptide repeat-containing protein at5g27270 [Phtheirospermum japonicum]